MDRFAIRRLDGRSNAQVVIDLVKGSEPGRLFTYEELVAALSVQCDHEFDVEGAQGAVVSATQRLLKEHLLALHNVRNVGYRVAHANEHTSLAMTRTRKADVQVKRGLSLLQNVRWADLDPNARVAHEGMLLVMSGFYQQQQAVERRLRNLERAFARAGLTEEGKAQG